MINVSDVWTNDINKYFAQQKGLPTYVCRNLGPITEGATKVLYKQSKTYNLFVIVDGISYRIHGVTTGRDRIDVFQLRDRNHNSPPPQYHTDKTRSKGFIDLVGKDLYIANKHKPSNLGIFSLQDMGELHLVTHTYDNGDWQGYDFVTKLYISINGIKVIITESQFDWARDTLNLPIIIKK